MTVSISTPATENLREINKKISTLKDKERQLLQERNAEAVRLRLEEGVRVVDIANVLGVKRQHIYNIIKEAKKTAL